MCLSNALVPEWWSILLFQYKSCPTELHYLQILDMGEQELFILAKHLGHDVKTNKEYYRLTSHALELIKVSILTHPL